jgi:hypothetical protein
MSSNSSRINLRKGRKGNKGHHRVKSMSTSKRMNRNMISSIPLLSGDVAFPSKLRAKFRTVYSVGNAFSSAGTSNYIATINNPINVIASQNMSGLAWLISGAQSNGTSFAPYTLGVVRSCRILVYAKTCTLSTNNTGVCCIVWPLALGQTSNSLALSAVEEQFGRSNVVELPASPDTNMHKAPLITKNYNLSDLIGIDEETYLNNPLDYGFNYNGLLGSTQPQCANFYMSTDTGSSDATLIVRANIQYEVEIQFSARTTLISSAPHV